MQERASLGTFQSPTSTIKVTTNLVQEVTTPNGVTYTQALGLFINNEWVAVKSGEEITVISPIDESQITKVHAGGADDIDVAVKAARAALKGPWAGVSGIVLRLADLAEQHTKTLASIDTWNNGKRFSSACGDVGELTDVLRYYAGLADKLHGQEQTPLSVLLFATLIQQAGFPAGVINVVKGYGRAAGAALAAHEDVAKIAFTGSTQTGREIMKLASATLQNITLETGGKSPAIIFGDAELEQAVKWCRYGVMANQGQICTATSRILVHESIHDKFVDLFIQEVQKTSKVGDPFSLETFQGPQVNKAQFDRVLANIASGKEEGAECKLGGQPYSSATGKGHFVEPTVFTGVKDHMKIYREEIFGPCVAISSFSTEVEAIDRANDSFYGLGAALFTRDITRAHVLANKIESGTVRINSSNDSNYRIPFGGLKQSGIGRELGEAGIAAYTNIKAVHVNMGNRL
ncbi:putative aldehyde dehydrogenase-like protein [Colletotrichum aenigma]|uniref:putative aldehyde dehydrogenase-like protein n=1 Tax=Colletotrichum aenigma TaxID=1215731 RepID=UPI001872A5FD|nr:putative aldehyde dehydrogenase-like protein [Colletotrichum aenigma]KAF5502229.1 putative aldehyde dehydrogenase-like protein [Colletotrichum aenigma]